MGVTMDQDDEVRPEEEARDLPDNIWFDLLNVVPLLAPLAYVAGAWLPPLFCEMAVSAFPHTRRVLRLFPRV
jgi:hypothetical protein